MIMSRQAIGDFSDHEGGHRFTAIPAISRDRGVETGMPQHFSKERGFKLLGGDFRVTPIARGCWPNLGDRKHQIWNGSRHGSPFSKSLMLPMVAIAEKSVIGLVGFMSGAEALSLATVVTPKSPPPVSDYRPATAVAEDFSTYVSGLTEEKSSAEIATKIDGDSDRLAAGTGAFLLSTDQSEAVGRPGSATEREEQARGDGVAAKNAVISGDDARQSGAGTTAGQPHPRDASHQPEERGSGPASPSAEENTQSPQLLHRPHERVDASDALAFLSGLDAAPDRISVRQLPEAAPSNNTAGTKTKSLAALEPQASEADAAPAPTAPDKREQSAAFIAAAPAQAGSITRDETVAASELPNPVDTANVPPPYDASDPEARASFPAPPLDAKAEKVGAEAPRLAAFEVASITKRRDGVLELRLDPPDLGAVSIRFYEDDAGAQHASISAEQRETLDLLRRNADLLQRELQRNGAGEFILEFSDRPRSGNPSDGERKRPVFGLLDGEKASLRAFPPASMVIEVGGVDRIA